MAKTNTPKKSNLVRYFLIPFFVILIAQIIGRSAAGGEVDQQFCLRRSSARLFPLRSTMASSGWCVLGVAEMINNALQKTLEAQLADLFLYAPRHNFHFCGK